MNKRTLHLTLALLLFAVSMAHAQKSGAGKSVAILGDSYSTFQGYITPDTNETWYFDNRPVKDNDVVSVEQTWWHQLLTRKKWRLCTNNSFSGSTISSSGYRKQDYTSRSFVTRAPFLGDPDIIFIFGATNDSWVPSPIGEYKFSQWTDDDMRQFRPSLAKLLHYMQNRYVNVDIYFILNSELSTDINASVDSICGYYGVPVIQLRDIEKKAGHPSVAGMKAIADQIDAFVRQDGKPAVKKQQMKANKSKGKMKTAGKNKPKEKTKGTTKNNSKNKKGEGKKKGNKGK